MDLCEFDFKMYKIGEKNRGPRTERRRGKEV